VTGPTFSAAAAWSFGIAAAGWLLLGLRMALGSKRSLRAGVLLGVALITAAWAACGAWFGWRGSSRALMAFNFADSLRYAGWFAFVAVLLAGGAVANLRTALPRAVYALAALLLATSVALIEGSPVGGALDAPQQRTEFAVRVGLAILGLVTVEQLYRRLHPLARWGTKPLCIGLAAVFAYDLVLFADGLLFGRLDVDIWLARGIANALVIPFVAVATARNTGWTIELHLSREAVFQSTALLVSGVFLLLVAGGGYIVRYLGGDWGRALQIELVFAATVLLVLVLSSGRFRSWLRVFVSKHFFSYRYDYREEWLRFTRTLSTDNPVLGTQERAIMALADLVESPGGALWLVDDRGVLRPVARLNMQPVDGSVGRDAALPTFLDRSGWVISVPDFKQSPDAYAGLEFPSWLLEWRDAWLVVPLATDRGLIGFVVLVNPRSTVDVDWEVRDLLKAAARAAASYLAQIHATEALLEARKFDAFNRMSAFVVHDLKNLVAQLSLMLRNAERHRDNPEFQRDMLDTVAHVVSRMNALMLQLRAGATPVENARPVDLEPLVRRVCAAKVAKQAALELDLAPGILALGHEERLEHVIGHLVQNAIDATVHGGCVRIAVRREDQFAVVEVSDTGSGMSAEFVSERLFKPFETTKTSGMGIGVYESQQYVVGLGGQILVESAEGKGTRVRVLLPPGDGTRAPTSTLKEAA
jgi:putative PEP-CTERM system histidine kinase